MKTQQKTRCVFCRTELKANSDGWVIEYHDCKGGDHIVDDNKNVMERALRAEARVKELESIEAQRNHDIARLVDKIAELEAVVDHLEKMIKAQLVSQQAGPKQGELIEVWDYEGKHHIAKFLCCEGSKVWTKYRTCSDKAARYDHWRPIQPAKESVEELQRLGRLV